MINFIWKTLTNLFLSLLVILPAIFAPAQNNVQAAQLIGGNNHQIYLPIVANHPDYSPAPRTVIFTGEKSTIDSCIKANNLADNLIYDSTIKLNSLNLDVHRYDLNKLINVGEVKEAFAEPLPQNNPTTGSDCTEVLPEPNRIFFSGNGTWLGDGSPWLGDGSGLPFNDINEQQQQLLFGDSDAMTSHMDDWYTGTTPGIIDRQTGADVKVFVLDTSPFTEASTQTIAGPNSTTWSLSAIHLIEPSATINGIPCKTDPSDSDSYTNKMKEHGMYAASLINAMALDSQIELIRVLNHCGLTDSWTIIRALYYYAARWKFFTSYH